jgi:Fic family protein
LWVYSQARRTDIKASEKIIRLTEIRQIHEQLVNGVWSVFPHPNQLQSETAGGFRKHDIMPFAGGMKPPSFTEIHSRLRTLVDEMNHIGAVLKENKAEIKNIPIRLAKFHCEFEHIHPFLDGNGRTGRLILNLVLVRLGLPPAIILKQRRTQYLNAMQTADNGDYLPLARIIAHAVIDSVNRFITPGLTGSKKLVPLRFLETESLKYPALRQAATRGRLEATIGPDGIWYSSKKEIEKYINSKYKRDSGAKQGNTLRNY